ncbi:unnamed protein product [Prunus armeniaca]
MPDDAMKLQPYHSKSMIPCRSMKNATLLPLYTLIDHLSWQLSGVGESVKRLWVSFLLNPQETQLLLLGMPRGLKACCICSMQSSYPQKCLETQKAWAADTPRADIPRGMGYTSNQQHGNLMGVLHQPKGEHEFALYKLSDAHSFKGSHSIQPKIHFSHPLTLPSFPKHSIQPQITKTAPTSLPSISLRISSFSAITTHPNSSQITSLVAIL